MPLDYSQPFPKRPRLQSFNYQGCYRYFITINTFKREEYFISSNIFNLAFSILQAASRDYDFTVWAYCFMPDHIHLLVEGNKDNSDLQKYIKIFKQKSGYIFKKEYGKRLWHTSYYDHILRREGDAPRITEYIINNPVRAGLVGSPDQYPFSGLFI